VKYGNNEFTIENDVVHMRLNDDNWTTIDAEEFEKVRQYTWGSVWPKRNRTPYAAACACSAHPHMYLHRFIMAQYHDLTDMTIDHRNRDSLDNRKSNLAVVSRRENALNRGPKVANRYGYKGVQETKWGTYKAKLTDSGQYYYAGTYKTIEEAAEAFDRKSLAIRGDLLFSGSLNFPHKYEEYRRDLRL
jgi:hypothetical protein